MKHNALKSSYSDESVKAVFHGDGWSTTVDMASVCMAETLARNWVIKVSSSGHSGRHATNTDTGHHPSSGHNHGNMEWIINTCGPDQVTILLNLVDLCDKHITDI